jgi:hypothetical protein
MSRRLLLLLCSIQLRLHCALDISFQGTGFKQSKFSDFRVTTKQCCGDVDLSRFVPKEPDSDARHWGNHRLEAPRHIILRLRGGLVVSRKQLEQERCRQQEAARQCADDGSETTTQEDVSENWKPMCRICYDDDTQGLFAPCHCSGSMGFVHR